MPIAQEFKDLICEIQETLHHCGYDGSYSTFRELPNWAVYENYGSSPSLRPSAKADHTRLKCAFASCVHCVDHMPSAGSA